MPQHQLNPNSPAWKNHKKAYYKEYAKRCAICGSKGGTIKKGPRGGRYKIVVDLHHLTYSFGYLPPFEHLVPLCRNAHKNLHKYQKRTGIVLPIASKQFILDQKAKRPKRAHCKAKPW